RPGRDPLADLHRVEVHATSVHLILPIERLAQVRSRLASGETATADADASRLRIVLPIRMRLRSGRTWILREGPARGSVNRDPVLINALRSAHALIGEAPGGLPTLEAAPTNPHDR